MSSAGIQSWTLTPSDNTTVNGINIGESCPAANVNNALRQIMSSALQEIAYRGADISASISMSLAGIDYRLANVTGSASIIHVGNGRAGLVRNLVWHSPSTLVNSANILCDGGANIVTVTNDITVFTSFGSGVWRAVHFPVSAQTVNTNNIADNAVTFAKMQAITDGHLLGASGGTAIEEVSVGSGLQLSGNVLSATTATTRYYGSYTTNTGLTTTIPRDDTIPTSTEGTQVISVNVTTTSSTQRVRVRFQSFVGAGGNDNGIVALFRDTTCIQASEGAINGSADYSPLVAEIEEVPGSAATFAYSARVGGGTGTVRLNGTNSARNFGGTAAATLIIDVWEP